MVNFWCGQCQILEKVEMMEAWMVHMEGHVHCDFDPLLSLRLGPDNPTPVNLIVDTGLFNLELKFDMGLYH